MPFVFSHTKYCDMHFMHGYCNGNARTAVEEYQRCIPNQRILSKGVFSCVYQTMRETGCLSSVCVLSKREVVPDINI
jgi:hypothetical protein